MLIEGTSVATAFLFRGLGELQQNKARHTTNMQEARSNINFVCRNFCAWAWALKRMLELKPFYAGLILTAYGTSSE